MDLGLRTATHLLILAVLSTAKHREINELSERGDRNTPFFFPDIDTGHVNTTKVLPSSAPAEDLQNSLIEVLEKINVLPESCIKFEKITREVVHLDKKTGVRTIGVYLYFQESSSWKESLDDRDSKGLSPLSNSKSDTSTENIKSKHKVRCKSESNIVMMDAYSLIGSKSNISQDPSGSESKNVTGVLVGAHNNNNDNNADDGGVGGISRTQLVVISTCSAIIGTFFLIAGILRLRNYIKRYRQQQQQATRPTFRSCSVALRNSTPSNEHIHRDSLLSKSSSFHSNYTGRGAGPPYPASQSSRDNSRNSSPKAYADKTPLLVVTSPSDTTNTSTPTVSQVSLQYADEEPIKNKNVKKSSSCPGEENRPLLNGEDSNGDVDIGQVSDPVENVLNNKGQEVSVHKTYSGESANRPREITVDIPEAEITKEGLVKNAVPSQTDGSKNGKPQNELSPTVTDSTMLLNLEHSPNGNVPIGNSNFGLTQSDSSLSSSQSYSYGNQTEYHLDLSPYEIPVGMFVYENSSNPHFRPLPMPTLVSFSENSFDYGSGASSMQQPMFAGMGDKFGQRTKSLHGMSPKPEVPTFKRSMSLAEGEPSDRGNRLLKKTNSISGGDNSNSFIPHENSIHEHCEQSDEKQASSSGSQSAQQRRERFGCGHETSIRSSGDISREPSAEATRPPSPKPSKT